MSPFSIILLVLIAYNIGPQKSSAHEQESSEDIVLDSLPQSVSESLKEIGNFKVGTDKLDSTNPNHSVTMNGNRNYYADLQIFNFYVQETVKGNSNNSQVKEKSDVIALFSKSPQTWDEARRSCILEGGHLAVITSKKEEEQLLDALRVNRIESAWLGIHDMFEEDDWVTVLDEQLDNLKYIHWAKNEPNNRGSAEHCATIMKNGMNDRECDEKLSYFCRVIND